MKSAYVVRELVTVAPGEKELRTHYEFGTFPTYQAANQCAIGTRNPSCFPQREEAGSVSRHGAATLLENESSLN